MWLWVGGLYVHTLVKNLLIKFLMMLFLVTKGCKFDSCGWLECLPEACKSAWQVKSAQVRDWNNKAAFFKQRRGATGVLTVL